jgi:DNA-binding CsgD family transcriptional regulator
MKTTPSLPQALYCAVAFGLDLLPTAILVVDRRARILHANQAAKEAAGNGRTIAFRDGCLLLTSPRQGDVLQKMLSRQEPVSGPVCLSIAHPPGKPCSVVIVPLDGDGTDGSPAALVFLADPELPREPRTELLAQLFGFTVAQARVAALLMQGKNVEEVSATLGITQHTARNHLKRLFLKTKTKKQMELVQMLMSSPACLRLPAHNNGYRRG